MCAIVELLDGTAIESCGELRAQGYVIPSDVEDATDFTGDEMCLCYVNLESVLTQQPDRHFKRDPFGWSEVAQ